MKRLKATVISMLLTATAIAQGVVDVHSHIITPEYISALKEEDRLMDEGFPLPKYDVAHSPEGIRMLLSITTPDHLLYGSDFPYAAPKVLSQGLDRMKQYLTTEADLAPFGEMILWKNARNLFPSLK